MAAANASGAEAATHGMSKSQSDVLISIPSRSMVTGATTNQSTSKQLFSFPKAQRFGNASLRSL